MRLLGKYESLGVLGTGSMGQVHVARPIADPATTVVVKVMRRDVTDSPQARQFFEREVQYTSRLNHPYIVRILDSGVDAAVGPCLVMEFVPGTSFEQLLYQVRRLDPRRMGWLAGSLCHAMEAAHTSGVIHRDLKPANLMVVGAGTSREHFKVMDFGLAQLGSRPFLSKERFEGVNAVRAQGTPAYVSPEQLRGDDVDGRADLYATGVILFEALAGRLPFADSEVVPLLEAHVRRPPPRFADLGIHDVPAALEAVVQRCLAKFPSERFASARVLAGELGRVLGMDLWSETMPAGELRAQDQIPMAEDVPADSASEPDTLVRQVEAWMPDRIAIIKLGGFLSDSGGELLETQPGLLQARFPPRSRPGLLARLLGSATDDGIELDLLLRKPNPSQSRLEVTAVFHVPGGGAPRDPSRWSNRCLMIFEEMKRYLMAG